MSEKEYFISKDDSICIKGLAIICMVAGHIFTPNWIKDNISIWDFNLFQNRMAHVVTEAFYACVSLFAFLSGYAGGYKEENTGKRLQRILSLYMTYWLVTLLINYPLVKLNVVIADKAWRVIDWGESIKVFLGISARYSRYCWYVPFFALATITSSKLNRMFGLIKNAYVRILCIISSFLCFRLGVRLLIDYRLITDPAVTSMLQHYNAAMPSWLTGRVVYKERLYEKWNMKLEECAKCLPLIASIVWIIGIAMITMVIRFALHINSTIEHYYVLFEMFALLILIKHLRRNVIIERLLNVLGKYSLYIWLIHAVFMLDFIQPVTFALRIPILILEFVLLISLLLALPIAVVDQMVKKAVLKK